VRRRELPHDGDDEFVLGKYPYSVPLEPPSRFVSSFIDAFS
jgi:hypothetical protein